MDGPGNAGMLPAVPPEMTVTSPLARASRWLPPLVVAGALAWLTAVGFGDGRRTVETSVRMRWGSPTEAPAIVKELRDYLGAYGADPEARWFAIEALARVGRPADAVDVAAETPGFATTAGAAKRLADLLLVTLGSYRTDPSLVTWLFGRTVQARIEAGDRGARAELDRLVAKIPANGIIGLFMPAVRSPGSVASTALGEALASRKETREFRAAAAILLTTPGRLEELPFLIDVLQSSWRDDRRPTWQQVVRTLGATGDPRAVEALERARADLVGDAPFTRLLRDSVDVGLALAERPDARERVMATLSAASSDWIALLYANGLLTRWVHGDEGALPRIAAVWDADPPRMVRMQLLYGCAMAEKPPTGLPLDAWAALAAGGDDPMSRSIGLAWQFRRKVPGAAEALLALLKTTIRGEGMDDDTGVETPAVSATLDILRTFARWG